MTEENNFKSINILVVEDEEFSQRFVMRILEKLGVGRIITAGGGAEALNKLAEDPKNIDLVICDIEMPEMDGYEFVRRVRYGTVPEYKKLPILILTGKDTDSNVEKARIHKIDGFIVKPATLEDLDRHIRRVMGL